MESLYLGDTTSADLRDHGTDYNAMCDDQGCAYVGSYVEE